MKACPNCIIPLLVDSIIENTIIFKCPWCEHKETVEEPKQDKLPPFEEWSEQDKKTFQEFYEWGRKNYK
jgi:hypothetical protein